MSLTRLVLRERALLESRPRGMSGALVDHLVPLQERLDDWRRAIAALDKESARGALLTLTPLLLLDFDFHFDFHSPLLRLDSDIRVRIPSYV